MTQIMEAIDGLGERIRTAVLDEVRGFRAQAIEDAVTVHNAVQDLKREVKERMDGVQSAVRLASERSDLGFRSVGVDLAGVHATVAEVKVISEDLTRAVNQVDEHVTAVGGEVHEHIHDDLRHTA
jgi:hypothetical protein